MIRVVVYLLIVAALAFGAVWLADRPGDVVMTWQGRRIETSVMVLAIAVAAVVVLALMLWSLLRAILHAPDALSHHLRARRGVRGYLALSQGLIAVGSGDARGARRFADEAGRIAPGEPLTLLLAAQAAQLSGDREGAARTFQQMAGRDDTRLLGLHGLFVEARRRNDPAAALLYAEEAARLASVPGWAGQAVLEFRCVAGDWAGALERLERNAASGLIDKAAWRRQRAVLLTAQALAAEDGDRERAKALALEAVKLAPDLVPAAALVGRLLADEPRKAARIVEAAWRASPHPDLAEAYAWLRKGSSARERLARVEALAAKAPGNVEGALAVARAALDARELAVARAALSPLAVAPTRRVAALMAELEEAEGDEGRAREWMARALTARRDPAWTADGFVADRWLPVSPASGRLDAFEWKDPLAGEDHAGAVIEAVEHPAMESAGRGALDEGGGRAVERSASGEGSLRPAEEPDHPPFPGAERERERTDLGLPSARRSLAPVAVAPAVIPLVHAPDDPGPDAEPHAEPAPEPTNGVPADGWTRIRALFKP
jgi:HemY protein